MVTPTESAGQVLLCVSTHALRAYVAYKDHFVWVVFFIVQSSSRFMYVNSKLCCATTPDMGVVPRFTSCLLAVY